MKKLQKNQGFTLVELLCCAMILGLFSTAVAFVMRYTGDSFFSSVQNSEAHAMVSLINATVSDEFRYTSSARRTVDAGGKTNVKYLSPSQCEMTEIVLSDGKLYTRNDSGETVPLLSPSAYTKDCSIANLEIDIDADGITYTRSNGAQSKSDVRRITVSYDVNDHRGEQLLHESFEVIPAES